MRPRHNRGKQHVRRSVRYKVGPGGETLDKRGQGHLEIQYGCLANWQYVKAQRLVLHIVAFQHCETIEARIHSVPGKVGNWQPLELERAFISTQSFITSLKSYEDIKDKPLKSVSNSAKFRLKRFC